MRFLLAPTVRSSPIGRLMRRGHTIENIAIQLIAMYFNCVSNRGGRHRTVGVKRNLTVCVNLDDHNLYGIQIIIVKRALVALTLSGWHNFFEARGCAGYSEYPAQPRASKKMCHDIRSPTHGIQKIRMKWMRFCMGMDLAMCTSESWLYFILIPT